MPSCEYSVIKYVPDIVRFEPVNIGVSLVDREGRVARNRFITDFGPLFARLGTRRINGLERSFQSLAPEVAVDDEDHLWRMHERFNGSIFYSEPATVEMPAGRPALEKIFDRMISVKAGPRGRPRSRASTIRRAVGSFCRSRLPSSAFSGPYAVPTESDLEPVRDFAFFRDGRILYTIDVLDGRAHARHLIKLFLYEIDAMNAGAGRGAKPYIFAPSGPGRPRGLHAGLLDRRNVTVVPPERHSEVLEGIRSALC